MWLMALSPGVMFGIKDAHPSSSPFSSCQTHSTRPRPSHLPPASPPSSTLPSSIHIVAHLNTNPHHADWYKKRRLGTPATHPVPPAYTLGRNPRLSSRSNTVLLEKLHLQATTRSTSWPARGTAAPNGPTSASQHVPSPRGAVPRIAEPRSNPFPPPGRSPSCPCRLGDSPTSLPLQPLHGKCRRRRARRPVRSCIRSRIGGCCCPRRHGGPKLHLVQVPCYRTLVCRVLHADSNVPGLPGLQHVSEHEHTPGTAE